MFGKKCQCQELSLEMNKIKNEMAEIISNLDNRMKARFKMSEQEMLEIRNDVANEGQRTNLRIKGVEQDLHDDIERIATNMTKAFDKRLSELGEKKSIVTSLLKRIAELEGLVEDKNVT